MQSLQQFLFYALGGLVFLLVITVLVAVHELGHFWVARLCGMKVDAFAIMMGGRRETDLAPRLQRPLAPPTIVWWTALACAAAVMVGALAAVPVLFTVGLAALALGMPVWVVRRLGLLYHLTDIAVAKVVGICWLVAIAVLSFAARGSRIELNQVVAVMGYASLVAIAVVYYQPVGKKGEEGPMGEGTLHIDGEDVEVRFRPLLSHKAPSGTEYSLLLLPLGGFAAIHGMAPKADGSETKIEGGFYSKTPLRRLAALFAGPLFSVLFGVLLFVALFTTVGRGTPDKSPVLGSVSDKGVAEKAGLKAGDKILKVNGQPIADFYGIVCAIRVRPFKATEVVYERDGAVHSVTLTPEQDKEPSAVLGADLKGTDDKRRQGKIGISPKITYERLPLGAAFAEACSAPIEMIRGLVSIVKKPATAKDEIGGPGTIAAVTVEATRQGLATVLLLAAGLSISLGVMNLLPFPPLDGGQMVVAFIELLRGGRRLSMQVQQMIFSGGFLLVCVMIFSVLALDVSRFVSPKEKPTTDRPMPANAK